MAKINIKAKGMHCPSCEVLIKESLEELEGINKAEASSKTGIVKVDYDDNKITMDEIKNNIKKEGHDVL